MRKRSRARPPFYGGLVGSLEMPPPPSLMGNRPNAMSDEYGGGTPEYHCTEGASLEDGFAFKKPMDGVEYD